MKFDTTQCRCGHSIKAHVYHTGACRPGFVCEAKCESFSSAAPVEKKTGSMARAEEIQSIVKMIGNIGNRPDLNKTQAEQMLRIHRLCDYVERETLNTIWKKLLRISHTKPESECVACEAMSAVDDLLEISWEKNRDTRAPEVWTAQGEYLDPGPFNKDKN